jgi:hypothetical protein
MVKESTRVVRVALPEGSDAKVQNEQTRRAQLHDGLGGLIFLLAWSALEDEFRFVACPNEVVFNTESKDCQQISQADGTSDSGASGRLVASSGCAESRQQKCRGGARGVFGRIRGAYKISSASFYKFSSPIQKRKRLTRAEKFV